MSEGILAIPAPVNLDAERAVLGAMVLDNDCVQEVLAIVSVRDFYRHSHEVLFRAITDLHGRNEPIDYITIRNAIKANGDEDTSGGEAYLVDIVKSVPVSANVLYYAELVRQESIKRQLIALTREVNQRTFEQRGDLIPFLADVQKKFHDIFTTGVRALPVEAHLALVQALESAARSAEREDVGISENAFRTGFPEWDRLTGGMLPAELVLLIAPTKVGKTAFALRVSYEVCVVQGYPTLYITGEMPAPQISSRAAVVWGKIDGYRMRRQMLTTDEQHRLMDTAVVIKRAPFWIDDTCRSCADIVRQAEYMVASKGVRFIVVDHLHRFDGPKQKGANREQEVRDFAKELKNLALRTNTVVLLPAQMDGEAEKRDDHRPRWRDVRDSKAAAFEADQCWGLYRESRYKEGADATTAELLLLLHREAEEGKIDVRWNGQFMRYDPAEPSPTQSPAPRRPPPPVYEAPRYEPRSRPDDDDDDLPPVP